MNCVMGKYMRPEFNGIFLYLSKVHTDRCPHFSICVNEQNKHVRVHYSDLSMNWIKFLSFVKSSCGPVNELDKILSFADSSCGSVNEWDKIPLIR